MTTARVARLAALGLLAGLATPAGAFAHGVQGRAETPIPISAFFWAAAFVLAVSFLALGLGWKRPLLARRPEHAAPVWLQWIAMSVLLEWIVRAIVLAAFAGLVAAAAIGSTELNQNIAPLSIFVVWWVGLVPLSLLFGNVWRQVNPWHTVSLLLRIPPARTDRPWPRAAGVWPAALLLLVVAWLELVYPTPSDVRLLAAIMVGYSFVTLVGMVRYGRDPWLDHAEVFSVYTAVIADMSPVRASLNGARRLRLRAPFMSSLPLVGAPGGVAFVCALIATVSFDGLSGSRWWTARDVAGAERLIERGVDGYVAGLVVATVGLLATYAIVLGLFEATSLAAQRLGRLRASSRARSPMDFAHSLVPIAVAYLVAHYFTLFVFQAQDLVRLASDPLGRGWDLFGTADHRIDFNAVSPNAIWAVQVTAIVVGHVLGLVLAHDRALELAPSHRAAVKSQLPMLALMVLLTVSGLWSLSAGMNTVR